MENPEFLKKKYGNLHASPEVVLASRRTEKHTGEKISQNPEKQIQNYLDRFKEILDRKDFKIRKQGIEALKKILYKSLIIKDEDINYDYFIKQEQKIAEQQGYGTLIVPDNFKEKKKQEIQNDQKKSLDYWIDYLSSPDASYPDWAKYWAFRSMTEMGGYNKKEKKFTKRKKDSAQAFPTLNAGCLAEVIGSVIKKQENKDLSDLDPEFRGLLTTENFSKLYAYALEQFGDLKWENLENIRGYWKTYKQGTPGHILSETLQGYPLEWCTRNEETADTQLKGGDFHVYYSEDSKGVLKVPRLAIRMNGHRNYEEDENNEEQDNIITESENEEGIIISQPVSGSHTIFENLSDEQKKILGIGSKEAEEIYSSHKESQKYSIKTKDQFILDKSQTIGEIRGIEAGQNIDQFIQPVLDDKLKEFGKEGETYLKKSKDMKKVTEITEKHRTGQILNIDDLRFLYEIDYKIEGFGYKDDPRIKQILSRRNSKEDLKIIFNVEDDNELALCLIKDRKTNLLAEYIYVFDNLNKEVTEELINEFSDNFIIDNLKKFNVNNNDIIIKLIERDAKSVRHRMNFLNNLNSEVALKLIEKDQGICVAENIEKFTNLNLEVALKLINLGYDRDVAQNIERFNVDQNEVALKLVESDKIEFDDLKNFHSLNHEVALKVVEKGGGDYFFNNYKNFKRLDHKEIALKLIETSQGGYVAENLEKLIGVDHKEIALKLIETNQGRYVAENLEKFNVDYNEIAIRMTETYDDRIYLIRNFKKFINVDSTKIALKIIDNDISFSSYQHYATTILIDNINNFNDINKNEIVFKLVTSIPDSNLVYHDKFFNGLSSELASKFIENKFEEYVARNPEKFVEIDEKTKEILREKYPEYAYKII